MTQAVVSPETAAEAPPRKPRSSKKAPPRPRVGGGSGAREVPDHRVTRDRIVAHLKASSGPVEEADIARDLGVDRDQLRRVLLDLTGDGVVHLEPAGWALGDDLEYQRRKQDEEIDRRVYRVVAQSSELLTTPEIADRVGITEVSAAASLGRLQASKKVTPLRDKWSPGGPENERKPTRSRPTFAPRRTPREQVEDAIRNKRLTWSQIRDALPDVEPHQLRFALDLIGRDGLLSFNSKGYQLRKRKGPPSTPIGQPQQADLFA